MLLKNARERAELKKSAVQREKKLRAKFAKEKKQMEAYIEFVKNRYEDTAGKTEDARSRASKDSPKSTCRVIKTRCQDRADKLT